MRATLVPADFGLEQSAGCRKDYLEFLLSTTDTTSAKICGTLPRRRTFVSRASRLNIKFKVNARVEQSPGFKVVITGETSNSLKGP